MSARRKPRQGPQQQDNQHSEAADESAEVVAPAEPPTPADPAQPVLESAGEMEAEPAQLIDQQLGQLLATPLGLRAALEALLFASPEPLTVRRLGGVLDLRDSRLIDATLKQLAADYDQTRRGVQIVETSEGYRMATRELFGDLVLRLKGRRRRPTLSPAALETLAIVAYRQPIIRAEVEAIRGVESSGTLRNLIDMGLVEMVGRKDVLGRPPMYGTTAQFLAAFGLKDLHELPDIAELKRQYIESEKEAEQAEQLALAAQHEEEMRRRLEAADEAGQDEDAAPADAEDGEDGDDENEEFDDDEAIDDEDSDDDDNDDDDDEDSDDDDDDDNDDDDDDDGNDGDDDDRR